jgi:hypothetical protein
MIRITVSAAAYAAIHGQEPQGSPQRPVSLWLDKVTAERLAALRGPDMSYSDLILRLAELEAAL